MKILFDQGTPAPLRDSLDKHSVVTAFERGLSTVKNGDLIAVAEAEFDLLVTTDRNLRYQQHMPRKQLAILVLSTTSWPKIRGQLQQVIDAVESIQPGAYVEIEIHVGMK